MFLLTQILRVRADQRKYTSFSLSVMREAPLMMTLFKSELDSQNFPPFHLLKTQQMYWWDCCHTLWLSSWFKTFLDTWDLITSLDSEPPTPTPRLLLSFSHQSQVSLSAAFAAFCALTRLGELCWGWVGGGPGPGLTERLWCVKSEQFLS